MVPTRAKIDECADLSTTQNGIAFHNEVTGWGRLRNAELYDLHFSPNFIWVIKSRRVSWAGHVARIGDRRVAHRVLVGRPEGKRPLVGPRLR